MSIRAKFYITEITQLPGHEGGRVKLGAVSRGSRNAQWSQATPSGDITMNISNPAAFQWFQDLLQDSTRGAKPSPEVFIDFTRADDPQPGDGHTFVGNADLPATHYAAKSCVFCGIDEDRHQGSAA